LGAHAQEASNGQGIWKPCAVCCRVLFISTGWRHTQQPQAHAHSMLAHRARARHAACQPSTHFLHPASHSLAPPPPSWSCRPLPTPGRTAPSTWSPAEAVQLPHALRRQPALASPGAWQPCPAARASKHRSRVEPSLTHGTHINFCAAAALQMQATQA